MNDEQLLQYALNEIKDLRGRNREMSVRLEIYDNMVNLFNARPDSRGYGAIHPDDAFEFEIEKRLSKKEKE